MTPETIEATRRWNATNDSKFVRDTVEMLVSEVEQLQNLTISFSELLNIREEQLKEELKIIKRLQTENEQLLEACQKAYGIIQYIYCHDANYPELKYPLDEIGTAINKVRREQDENQLRNPNP